jgi:hypothetical protein
LLISKECHVISYHIRHIFKEERKREELTVVKRRKRAWFGHVTRHDSLSKKLFFKEQFKGLEGKEVNEENWPDNIKEWTKCNLSKLLPSLKRGSSGGPCVILVNTL